jgi:ubiquinone/menaquinone biosynthesis C-methylase UbiE
MTALGLAASVLLAAALWWRTHPSACPYGQRFWVEMPHPFVTRERLLDVLAPEPGERVLEIGPGTGYYSLSVAERLGDDGRLDLLDLQQEMLDHTERRGERKGLNNLCSRQGDAERLPYPDASFDAAFMCVTLGEVPDQLAALAELRRVLKEDGRLVVGELFGDPHWVPFGRLQQRAAKAGLSFERRLGGALGYFARFCPAADPRALSASAAER